MNFQGTDPILGMGSLSKLFYCRDTAYYCGAGGCGLCDDEFGWVYGDVRSEGLEKCQNRGIKVLENAQN